MECINGGKVRKKENMSQLDTEQTEFIRNITDDSVEIKDVIVAGMHLCHISNESLKF